MRCVLRREITMSNEIFLRPLSCVTTLNCRSCLWLLYCVATLLATWFSICSELVKLAGILQDATRVLQRATKWHLHNNNNEKNDDVCIVKCWTTEITCVGGVATWNVYVGEIKMDAFIASKKHSCCLVFLFTYGLIIIMTPATFPNVTLTSGIVAGVLCVGLLK